MTWFAIYALAGAFVGFLAGLLGIGGGMTLVPVLSALYTAQSLAPDHTVHLALGTAMASVVFTSSSSVRAHHRHGAVDWSIVRSMAPGLVAGSLVGPQIASALPARTMAAVFTLFMWFTAFRMVRNAPPKPSRELPGAAGLFGVGAGIGLLSGIVGAGGAFLSVPFMVRCNVRMHAAVATSAALGLPIALAATVGFVYAGLRKTGLPPYSVGYVYLPALAAFVAASMLSAPYGARVAHSWDVARLKRVFAVLMTALGGYMAWRAARG